MRTIKDYLHLYFGQACLVRLADDSPDGYYDTIDCDSIQAYLNDPYERTIQPILRPLSDMKEDEAKVIDQMCLEQLDGVTKPSNTGVVEGIRTRTSDALVFMLSKGFDLFGLIEEELAIDASEIKNIK